MRLGCCDSYQIFFTDRCGAPRLCEPLSPTSLEWGRKLDDVSEATVIFGIANSGVGQSCCDCLKDLHPWCHEMQIFRCGEFVWTGPVQDVVFTRDFVEVRARDLLAWAEVRIPEIPIDNATAPKDITLIGQDVLNVAFAEDDPCILEFVQRLDSRLTDTALTFPAFEQTALEQLNDLAEIGLDYTVIGRRVLLGGDDFPVRAIGVLTDENILGDITVSRRGDLMGNRFFVRYPGDDDPDQCAAQNPTSTTVPCPAIAETTDRQCYGVVERLIDSDLAIDFSTAQQAANSYLNAGQIAPLTIEFPSGSALSPDTPIEINDFVPGQRVDVALSSLCVEVFQSFRLQELNVRVDETGEQVTIDASPVNLITGQP